MKIAIELTEESHELLKRHFKERTALEARNISKNL